MTHHVKGKEGVCSMYVDVYGIAYEYDNYVKYILHIVNDYASENISAIYTLM